MRVLLVDDHEIIWNGTQRLLECIARDEGQQPALAFTAVRCLADALCLPADGFDLLLLDYHLPDSAGLASLAALQAHFEAVPVCMMSAERDPARVRAVMEAGAAGFLPKAYRLDEMQAALRVVLRHRVYLPAEFVLAEDSTRVEQAHEVPASDLARFLQAELSARQQQVLALAIQGLPIKLIARQLSIAEGTVKVHLSMVYRAMGVHNRTGALCRIFKAQAAGALGQLPRLHSAAA